MSIIRKRALFILFGTLLAYGVLVGTHEGEFWPFSIYPMFSQAGRPWSRAIVHDIPDGEAVAWKPASSRDALPGIPFPLSDHGISPIDLADFIFKTETWSPDRVNGLRSMFYDQVGSHNLLVIRVNGRLAGRDSVAIEFVPYALVRADTSILNPDLTSSQ